MASGSNAGWPPCGKGSPAFMNGWRQNEEIMLKNVQRVSETTSELWEVLALPFSSPRQQSSQTRVLGGPLGSSVCRGNQRGPYREAPRNHVGGKERREARQMQTLVPMETHIASWLPAAAVTGPVSRPRSAETKPTTNRSLSQSPLGSRNIWASSASVNTSSGPFVWKGWGLPHSGFALSLV